MFWSFIIIVISCAVQVYSYNFHSGYCEGCKNDYTRIKRAKYYSYQPMKFYNRPPFSPPTRSPFPFTTQPGYNPNYIGPPLTSNFRPYKVSKRPTYEVLGNEDTSDLFQYLSKNDFDKIVENAIETDKLRDMEDKDNIVFNSNFINSDKVPYNDNNLENAKILNSPNVNMYNNFDFDGTKFNNQIAAIQNNHPFDQVSSQADALRNDEQFPDLDAYIQKEIEGTSPDKNNIYTDSRTMQEEQLPIPTNLRHDHYEISYTNEVPSVIKPGTSYKLENFADLPLMNHDNSKLYMVDSYNVPHYSVTSNHKPLKPASSSSSSFSSSVTSSSYLISPTSSRIDAPEVEPAPPASTAKEQSDAHLKATKIWTHKSKGTAYTLHDDGTLSLENPTRPKYK